MVDVVIHPPEGISFRNREGGQVACKIKRSRLRELRARILQYVDAYIAIADREVAEEIRARTKLTAEVSPTGEVVVQRTDGAIDVIPETVAVAPAEAPGAPAPFANVKDLLNIPRCPACLTAKPPGARRCEVCGGPI